MNRTLALLLVISLVGNALFSISFFQTPKTDETAPSEEQDRYPLLAKRIFIEDPNDIIINFNPLRKDLQELAAKENSTMGIYFEYLPTGVTIGINEKEGFRRASLVKIPTVMRAYKLIEEGKLSKQDELTIRKDHLDSGFGELYKEGEGTKITVEKVIELILTMSDNTAFNILRDTINEKFDKEAGSDNEILAVYDYLDIPKESSGPTLDISPKNFSSILMSLYFSSYLSYQNSNEILDIISKRNKTYNMLSAAVPEEVRVADKFGVVRGGDQETLVTSDCGIVYVPKRQYILCVMVKEEPEKAANKILAVSKMVYEYISTVNR